MKLAAHVRIPKAPREPWNSVVLRSEMFIEDRAGRLYMGPTMRRAILWLAKRFKIPAKQCRVVGYTAGPSKGIYGYIRVYRGKGTKAEIALFWRVYRAASRSEFGKVSARRPSRRLDPEMFR